MNFKNKIISISIIIFIFSTLLTGCFDRSELNEIELVLGMGIDKISGDNSILVTLEIADLNIKRNEGNMTGKSGNSVIEISTGKTLFDAIQNFTKTNSVEADFSHIKVIIMSQNLCKSGVDEVLDYVSRNRQFRNLDWILVSKNTAKEVLKSKIANENITSIGLANMMNNLKKDGFIVPVDLNRFVIGFESQSKASIAPVIELEKSADSHKKIKIDKIAVFKKNRLVDILNTEESKYLLWFYKNIKGGIVVSFNISSSNEESTAVRVYKKLIRIIPQVTEKGIFFKINCYGIAEIKETKNMKLDPKTVDKIKYNTEEILQVKLNELIRKCQSGPNVDVFGFAERIYNIYPDKWINIEKSWYKIFPKVKYQISFDITVDKAGMIKDSPISDEMEEKYK